MLYKCCINKIIVLVTNIVSIASFLIAFVFTNSWRIDIS